MAKPQTLSIIGAGKVGKTLGRLFAENGIFTICDVVDKTIEQAIDGVDFIGRGRPLGEISDMVPTDVYLLSVSDRDIHDCSVDLVENTIIRKNSIVFHCSGSQSSEIMKSVRKAGSFIASIHPVKSFTDSGKAVETFSGTFCGAEGDKEALDILLPAFESIGSRMFRIEPDRKTEFHTATAIVCNYLPVLIDLGAGIYEKAGISREKSLEIMEPIVRETIDNILNTSPAEAVTGPIVRGDCNTVEQHIEVLDDIGVEERSLYKLLGSMLVDLVESHRSLTPQEIEKLRSILT